jgi:hypothetical protein
MLPAEASASQNPLDEKTQEDVDLELTTKQTEYQSYLEKRLEKAKEVRDRQWAEFSDKTYLQYFEQNEKIANTYLEPKKNDDEVKIASGTIESKLNTLLSHIDNLNLTPEVHAFDKNDKPLNDLGVAITDVLDRLAEHDGGVDGGDAEKRLLRQKELLKQGTVFIQDKWCTKRQAKKKLTKKYDGSFNFGAWETSMQKVYEGPERTLLYGPNVYLGDITVFSMDEQPYVFTVETMHKDTAQGYFGQYDNWSKVTPGKVRKEENDTGARTIFDGKFRLTGLKDDQVEVIKYQDPTRDEFQIIINGIMMLPIGFPLSAVTAGGKINITKQILYPINPQFAYGKSFVSSGDVYELSKILDEMLRLFVLKTRKSITPPYINMSGKVISRRVLAPGNITQGIAPNALQPIGAESQGVQSGEFMIYQEVLKRIEMSTIGPSFQGQFGGSNTTATEVLEVQRQAKLALGIIISACTMLEVKLAYARIPIILSNYFAPVSEIMGDDQKVTKKYRRTSRLTEIGDEGKGMRLIIPTDGPLPNKDIVRALEIQDEKEYGYPSERIYLSPKAIRNAQLTWRVVVVPKEKESSAYEKLLFREMMQDALALINLGSKPNVAGLESQFASVYKVDRNELFADTSTMAPPMDMARVAEEAKARKSMGGGANASGVPVASSGMTSQVGAG